MEFKEKLNWSIIFKIKEISDYLTNYELKSVCLNREIRNILKPYIFRKVYLKNFKLKTKTFDNYNIGEYPHCYLEAQLNEFEIEYKSIGRYTQNLKISGSDMQVKSLNIPAVFHSLNHLYLAYIKLPLSNVSDILNNLLNLGYIRFREVDLIIKYNYKGDRYITLPKNLKNLDISSLKTIDEVGTKLQGMFYSRLAYNFKPQKLQNLKSLTIRSGSNRDKDNIKTFLSINSQTIKYLSMNEKNFDSTIFSHINSCINLTRLQLNNVTNDLRDILTESEFPKFPYIQQLYYKPRHAYCNPYPSNRLRISSFILFNRPLLSSFPNLKNFECLYEEEFKNDLITVISSLLRLEKLTLINSNSKNIVDLALQSNSLKAISFCNILSMKFKPSIVEKCPNVTQISLIDYKLNGESTSNAESYFCKFHNWRTIFFPKSIFMHST